MRSPGNSTMLPISPTVQAEIDQNTTLCLACSCSLPPKKSLSPSTSKASPQIFLTPCCHRPICPGCIAANPRLQRYDPCLACLGGVGLVGSTFRMPTHERNSGPNVNGAMRDEDTFVLGDVDDDEEDDDAASKESHTQAGSSDFAELGSSAPIQDGTGDPDNTADTTTMATERSTDTNKAIVPLKYYISRNDSLQGIALRFGLNGHELCRLNNLPITTLRTTPHLLHTRHYLILPPSARQLSTLQSPGDTQREEQEREARIQRERAEKRLQTLTKELDRHVAKAYVALADDPGEMDEHHRKTKEGGLPGNIPSSLGERAIGRYLDDDEWEANARRDGVKAGVAGLPFVNGWGSSDRTEKAVHRRNWW